MNRRSFVTATTSLAAAAMWSGCAFGPTRRAPSFSNYPFQLGVASGDPTPDGFVIWTRLCPKPIEGGGMPFEPVEVSWQVAEDEQMTRVVKKGRANATPQWAHSVHVEVSGLKPGRWYFYQFKAGAEISKRGRARTFPAANVLPEKLRFSFVSCQHYETGYYTGFQHMAREQNDIIIHLGDYIYEGGISAEARPRKHNSKEIYTLDDYRNRYGLYKSDDDLKEAHASAPWIVTPDDHEVANNMAGMIAERVKEQAGFSARRAAAYQAYYEHMPLRRMSLPKGPDCKLYRSLPYGRLADIFAMDTRQYRSDQPCGDKNGPQCPEALDPNGTLMGAKQRDWLFSGLKKSRAEWQVLAQQVMMGLVDRTVGEAVAYSMDQWPGYEMERRRVLRFLDENRIKNPVVLTGDIHTNWVNDLKLDFENLGGKTVGAEFVGTSISSSGDGRKEVPNIDKLYAENPFLKWHNQERGYVRCDVTPRQWRSDYQVLDYVSRKGSPIHTRASFVVENGRPGAQKA